jgi:hypothetical protein
LPEGVAEGAPASKILKDAGELATMGLELGDRNNWNLLDQFQKGEMTGDQFVDAVNKPGHGKATGRPNSFRKRDRGGNAGSGINAPRVGGSDSVNLPGSGPVVVPDKGNKQPGGQTRGETLPGSATGNSPAPAGPPADSGPASSTPPDSAGQGTTLPGSAGSGTPASGVPKSSSGTSPDQSPGPGNSNDSTESEDDDFTAEAVLGAGSYVIVTHNDDGSFTSEVIQSDGNGNLTVVQSETFTDSDGDGNYKGDKGGESSSKPNEGLYEGTETDEGTTFKYETESGSSDNSDDSSSDDSGDTSSADGDADQPEDDDDEYTPDPSEGNLGNLYNNSSLINSLYQMLSNEKFNAGKSGKGSTPNPMSETYSGKRYPAGYKSMISRPVDSTSTTPGAVPEEALGQMQDPNHVQGGVIDPKSR